MIPPARPTISPVVITILTFKMVLYMRDFEKSGQTDEMCEVITTGHECLLSEWINFFEIVNSISS